MSGEMKLTKRKVWSIYGVAALVLWAAVISAVFPGSGALGAAHRAEAANEASQILIACRNYDAEYGQMPESPENARLIKSLTGNNPRKIPFLMLKASQLNSNGEMIDPWGTPFRITFDSGSKVNVTSAGPDKIFGTADDENPWRTEDFLFELFAWPPWDCADIGGHEFTARETVPERMESAVEDRT